MIIGQKNRQLPCCGFVFLIGLALLSGCRGESRESLEGTVTLDGQPMERGFIQFRPIDNTAGPSAGADIVNGRFAVPAKGGTFVGKFRVEITASRQSGRKVMDQTGKLVDAFEQFIPARYNNQSELTAEVEAAGPNQFAFSVNSK